MIFVLWSAFDSIRDRRACKLVSCPAAVKVNLVDLKDFKWIF